MSVVYGTILLCIALAVVAKALSRNVAHLDVVAARIRYAHIVNRDQL